MLVRVFFALVLVGFAVGATPSAAQTAHLRAVRAEIAATHPADRLRAQVNTALTLFRRDTISLFLRGPAA